MVISIYDSAKKNNFKIISKRPIFYFLQAGFVVIKDIAELNVKAFCK